MNIRRIWPCLALILMTPAVMAQEFAIKGAKVFDFSSEQPLNNATVVVSEGRIASIVENGSVPAGMRVIAVEGGVVTPLLVNAATQLGLVEVGAAQGTTDATQSGNNSLGAAFDVHRAVDSQSVLLDQARADGLGWAALYPGSHAGRPFSGTGALLQVGDDGWAIARTANAVYAHTGAMRGEPDYDSRAAAWAELRARLEQAQKYRDRSRPEADLDDYLEQENLARLKQVLDQHLPLVIVANRESDLRQAIAIAQEFECRVIVQGGAEAWRLAQELADADIAVILDPLVNLPMSFDELGARSDGAAILHTAGVRLAFSVVGFSIHTTYNAGSSLREAAGWAVRSGMPYTAALGAITRTAAQVWGLPKSVGTLAPGMPANFVLWQGDPLEPATLPTHIFYQGEESADAPRQQLLRDRYLPNSTAEYWREATQ